MQWWSGLFQTTCRRRRRENFYSKTVKTISHFSPDAIMVQKPQRGSEMKPISKGRKGVQTDKSFVSINTVIASTAKIHLG